MRLDQAIASRFNMSRRKARELLAAGSVLVNHRRVSIASREVADEDHIAIVDEAKIEPLRVTDDWIAVNKPAGMPTQPERDRKRLSLEDILRAQYKKIWLVHRLDTPTSGVVLFARSAESAALLSRLFASREMVKTYIARVDPPLDQAVRIDSLIDGREALTEVEPGAKFVTVRIRTGRTHQIRRHLSSIGHPVIGDRRYGSRIDSSRLMLHAWRIEHDELGLIEAPVPAEFV